MSEVVIYHNPKCSTSKSALAVAEEHGVDAEIVQYLKSPLGRPALEALADMLTDPIEDLVRDDGYFKELGLDHAALAGDRDAVIDLIVEHPRLMQRPVLVKDGVAIIGRPKDRVPEFLS